MWFKNLRFFRLPEHFWLGADFDALLAVDRLRPILPVELATRGWVPPLGEVDPALCRRYQDGRISLVRLGTEEKLLPSIAIKQEVERRARVIEERDGRRPGKKQREQLKDDVVAEFTQRAFVRVGAVTGYIDATARVLVVDSASDRDAERLVTALRGSLGSFPVQTLEPREHVGVVLSEWVKSGDAAHGFALGDEVELKDPVETRTTIKAKRHDLTSEEIRGIALGKQVSQLALIFNGRISFTLDDKLTVRRLRFLDIVMDDLGDGGGDAVGEFDARMTLLTLEVRQLLSGLDAAFGLTAVGTCR